MMTGLQVITRVFSIKLWELINDIKHQHIYGRVTGILSFATFPFSFCSLF
jgi:hypothetical protein